MTTARAILAAAAALCLAACAAPNVPVATTSPAGQNTAVARTAPAAHVNPPETSSGY